MDWKDIPKIDAHVHILPEDRRQGFIKYQGEGCVWAKAELSRYIEHMEEYNVEKAILQPTNDSYMYYSASETNEYLAGIIRDYPDKFMAFADLNADGAYLLDEAPLELEYAVEELGLSGLKIHPNNLNMDADDLRLVPLLRKAAELEVPVMFHSNPCLTGFHDNCAPDKINRMIKIFPDIHFITAHMGGMKYLDAWSACTWVDISFILPELVEFFGLEQTGRILRMFGANRMIFGTDYPERDYTLYCSLLNEMGFSGAECEKIAYGNINSILGLTGRSAQGIHRMHLKEGPFELIKAGQKIMEIRLNDEKRRKIKIGDTIFFSKLLDGQEKIKVKVTGLLHYPSFQELYNDIPQKLLGYENKSMEWFLAGTYEIYDKEKEEKYGALAIRIEKIESRNM